MQDIVAGTFKGFAMLRSYATQSTKAPGALELLSQPAPVYIEGYGFIPPSQVELILALALALALVLLLLR